MSLKPQIACIVGKTIVGVVTSSGAGVSGGSQVFLAFEDGTYYELYGDIHTTSGLDNGGMQGAEEYALKMGGKIAKYRVK